MLLQLLLKVLFMMIILLLILLMILIMIILLLLLLVLLRILLDLLMLLFIIAVTRGIIVSYGWRRSLYLILRMRFLESWGRRCDPRQKDPLNPVTSVASSPLSEDWLSNSTSSPSARLRNPFIWMTLCTNRNGWNYHLKTFFFKC